MEASHGDSSTTNEKERAMTTRKATTTGKGQNSGRKSKKPALNKRLPDLTLGKNKADGVRGGGNCATGTHIQGGKITV
jgi:hypothetical protein